MFYRPALVGGEQVVSYHEKENKTTSFFVNSKKSCFEQYEIQIGDGNEFLHDVSKSTHRRDQEKIKNRAIPLKHGPMEQGESKRSRHTLNELKNQSTSRL